ncbi:MAG: hypothetical protein ACYDEJ_03395 [Desulfitobacteriaceae bacterium]
MSKFSARHGDIYLESINEIPEGAVERKSNIILGGTATGHAHKLINGCIFDKDETAYIQSNAEAAIVHEEHKRIDLPVGSYIITFQREYDPYEKSARQVID